MIVVVAVAVGAFVAVIAVMLLGLMAAAKRADEHDDEQRTAAYGERMAAANGRPHAPHVVPSPARAPFDGEGEL